MLLTKREMYLEAGPLPEKNVLLKARKWIRILVGTH